MWPLRALTLTSPGKGAVVEENAGSSAQTCCGRAERDAGGDADGSAIL